ncbi:hypothetical protein Csa_008667 [Cucumis sativus]|uniref:Uncharacterized protein n=1 Tax=Cucumis sativus TaxID=3659 RepID=A0A0A0KRY2_CUCSA|nr:hypothetical protein Csa_008667 [Cucumis sativus]
MENVNGEKMRNVKSIGDEESEAEESSLSDGLSSPPRPAQWPSMIIQTLMDYLPP